MGEPISPDFLSVLVVEDDFDCQKVARTLLEQSGYWPHVVGSAEEAFDALAVRSFDLVLVDVKLPCMDGLEMIRRLRSAEAGRDRMVPVIAVTACAFASDRDRCLDAGADHYLSKPYRAGALLTMVEEALRSCGKRGD